MPARIWDPFLTAQDKAHLAASRPKVPYGFGRRAAVLSVDNYRGAVGDRPEPLLDAIRTWPNSAGPAAWEALDRTAELLAAARAAGIPVIHVTGLSTAESGMPGWRHRRGERGTAGGDAATQDRHRRRYDIVEQAAPLPGEVVLKKTAPSAFFGTPLAAHLMAEGIDTLIVCGEAVSGCVRATVVDGCSYRLRMVVVEDCVFDRHEATWAMNLFDIDQKYGDVISLDETLHWVVHQAGGEHEHVSQGTAGAHELLVPQAVLAALPPDAETVSVSHHPIHGQVIARAGTEVVDAARTAMAGGFAGSPHVIAAIDHADPGTEPDLARALQRTEGGVLLVGVGYRSAEPAIVSTPEENACPECGSRDAHREDSLYVCADCGAAWDI